MRIPLGRTEIIVEPLSWGNNAVRITLPAHLNGSVVLYPDALRAMADFAESSDHREHVA